MKTFIFIQKCISFKTFFLNIFIWLVSISEYIQIELIQKNHHFWVVFKFVVGFSEAQSIWDRILFTDLQVSFNSWIIYNLLPLERTHRDLTNIYIYTFVYNIYKYKFVCFMVFNATFNNISVISWRQFCWWRSRRKLPTCRKSLTNFIT